MATVRHPMSTTRFAHRPWFCVARNVQCDQSMFHTGRTYAAIFVVGATLWRNYATHTRTIDKRFDRWDNGLDLAFADSIELVIFSPLPSINNNLLEVLDGSGGRHAIRALVVVRVSVSFVGPSISWAPRKFTVHTRRSFICTLASSCPSTVRTVMDENGLGPVGPILEETFYALSKKQHSYRVSLTPDGLYLIKNGDDGTEKTDLIRLMDIIGSKCMRNNGKSNNCVCRPAKNADVNNCQVRVPYAEDGDCSAYLCVYAYILKNVAMKNEKRDKMTVTLRFRNCISYEENSKVATKWKLAIKSLLKARRGDGTIVVPADNQYLGKFDWLKQLSCIK